MHMSFWLGDKIDNFLVYGFNVSSVAGLLGVCALVAGLALFFEWIKVLQAYHRQKELILRAQQLRTVCPTMERTALLPRGMHEPLDLSLRHRIQLYSCDASIWFLLHNLGYLLMLTVMVYNVWIFLAVLFGSGLGHFVFGQSFMKLSMENCQVVRDTYCMANCAKPDMPRDGESTPVEPSTSSTNCHSVEAQMHHNNLCDID